MYTRFRGFFYFALAIGRGKVHYHLILYVEKVLYVRMRVYQRWTVDGGIKLNHAPKHIHTYIPTNVHFFRCQRGQ